MMIPNKTHLDEIVDYPDKVFKELYKNKNFVSLLVNVPNADTENEDIEISFYNKVFDYDYVDNMIQTEQSFCCVDTSISMSTNTIKDVFMTVLIGVSHPIMSLRGTQFKFKGNRRDNLIRELDFTLRNSQVFGIGGLELVGQIKPVTIAGKDFACKVATYRVAAFASSKNIKR